MTNLPKGLLQQLEQQCTIEVLRPLRKQCAKDGTVKYLFGSCGRQQHRDCADALFLWQPACVHAGGLPYGVPFLRFTGRARAKPYGGRDSGRDIRRDGRHGRAFRTSC